MTPALHEQDVVRDEMAAILALRIRIALLVSVCATVSVFALDAFGRGRVDLPTAGAYILLVAVLWGLWRVTHVVSWTRSVALGTLTIGFYSLLLAISPFPVRGPGLVYLMLVLAMGTAAYLPWGAGPQAVSICLSFIALVVKAYDASDPTAALIGLFTRGPIVAVVTVLIARELHRQMVARVEEGLKRHQRELELKDEVEVSTALARVGAEMLAVADSPELLDEVCRLMAEAIRSDTAHVFLLNPKENIYSCIASHGNTVEEQEVLRVLRIPAYIVEPVLGELQSAGTDLLQVDHEDVGIRILHEYLVPEGVVRSLVLELRRRGELAGLLTAGRRHRNVPFTRTEERVAHGIGQLATLGLQTMALLTSLRQANLLKSEFVATMSHELRTPLHILMGYTDLVLEGEFGKLNQDQTRILGLIDKSARDLLELINTTLDLSRLDAGRVRVDISSFTVRDLLDEISVDMRPTIATNERIRFVIDAPPNLPRLSTDKSKLKVVLKNLLSNSYKFTDHGVIEVRARMAASGIEFLIIDSGSGISPAAQAVIFDAFQQGEASLTRSRGGVGLGLYIVRRLAALLGGTASLAATSPAGSTFSVWVPLEYRGLETVSDPTPVATTETAEVSV